MPGFKENLITRSRDRNFLLRGALLIGALGILSGFLVSKLRVNTPQANGLITTIQTCCPWLTDDLQNLALSRDDIGKLHKLFRISGGRKFTQQDLAEATRARLYPLTLRLGIAQHILKPETLILFRHYATSLHETGEPRRQSRMALKTAAENAAPRRFASEFHADILSREKDHAGALTYFKQEVAGFN